MFSYLVLAVFPAALLIASANDIYEFKIPNWLNLTLALAYPLAGFALNAPFGVMLEGAFLGAGFLVIGFTLFAFKIIGGGDAKLAAATVPWIGLAALSEFLIYTAIAGVVLTVVMSTFRAMPVLPVYAHAPWLIRLHERKKDLPYAVAIAGGGLLSFSQTPFFKLVFLG